MLSTGRLHEDLGPGQLPDRDRERRERHLVDQLKKLGVDVDAQEAVA